MAAALESGQFSSMVDRSRLRRPAAAKAIKLIDLEAECNDMEASDAEVDDRDNVSELIDDDMSVHSGIRVGIEIMEPFTPAEDDLAMPPPRTRPATRAVASPAVLAAPAGIDQQEVAASPSIPLRRHVGRPTKQEAAAYKANPLAAAAQTALPAKTATEKRAERETVKQQQKGARQAAAIAKKRNKEDRTQHELSVTAVNGDGDLSISDLQKYRDFVDGDDKILRTFAGMERGSKMNHLHLQIVVQTSGLCAAAFTRRLKEAMGWTGNSDCIVRSRAVQNNKLHTFNGLVGYCMKDIGRPHFRCAMKNITDQIIKEGFVDYILYGCDEDIKGKVTLSPEKLMERAKAWKDQCCKPFADDPPFEEVLLGMMRSGHYFLSTRFVQSRAAGMDLDKARALWRITDNPNAATMEDIMEVFFAPKPVNDRYFTRNSASYMEVVPNPDMKWLMTEAEVPTLRALQAVSVSRTAAARVNDAAALTATLYEREN
ncbi:hypothetical protein Ndes2526B_g04029 [Nannochloris sp. 'desiccata']